MADLTPEGLDKLKAQLAEAAKLQEKLTSGLDGYNEVLKLIRSNYRDIKNVNKNILANDKDILDIEKKIANATGDTKKTLEEDLEALKGAKKIMESQYKTMLAQNIALRKQLGVTNALEAGFSSLLKGGKNLAKTMWAQVGYLNDQSKAVKTTELSMGILSKQSAAFTANMFKASLSTNILGLGAKELAEIQGRYSNEIGSTISLTEQGLVAMSELAKGTVLGADGAAQMAASMFNFNISAERTRDFVEEALNNAHSMGVDASKATKNIETSLRLANRYHFKGGVKGALQMAVAAGKTKMDMESVAGFAEKLFSPEGAIDMSAQLQVLGGEWAKLADPFALMYKARNDPKALADDLARAASATAHFNDVTQEIDISPLEMHRLREVANQTGMDFDNLAESARKLGKMKEIKTRITGAIDPELKDYIANTADFDDEKKEFYITLDGKTKTYVNDLHNISSANIKLQLDAQKKEKATLEERAKQSQTFLDKWDNIQNTFRSFLLPIFEGFNTGLNQGLGDFAKWMKESKFTERLSDIGKTLGGWTASLLKFIGDNPIGSAISAVVGIGLFKAAQWTANGYFLAKGFNAGVNIGGLGGGGTPTSGVSGKAMMLGGVVAGLSAGVLEFMDNKDKGMKTEENLGRSVSKGAGAGLGAWGGAAAGAAIGSVVPIVGTAAGALIGGALGAWGGSKAGEEVGDGIYGKKPVQDFVMRPGEGAVPFSKNDTLVGAKPGGPIDKLLGSTNSGVTPGAIEISFKPLKIEFGDLILKTDGGSTKIDILSDSKLIRDLSKMINEQLRMAIGGGKLSPNPIR